MADQKKRIDTRQVQKEMSMLSAINETVVTEHEGVNILTADRFVALLEAVHETPFQALKRHLREHYGFDFRKYIIAIPVATMQFLKIEDWPADDPDIYVTPYLEGVSSIFLISRDRLKYYRITGLDT